MHLGQRLDLGLLGQLLEPLLDRVAERVEPSRALRLGLLVADADRKRRLGLLLAGRVLGGCRLGSRDCVVIVRVLQLDELVGDVARLLLQQHLLGVARQACAIAVSATKSKKSEAAQRTEHFWALDVLHLVDPAAEALEVGAIRDAHQRLLLD